MGVFWASAAFLLYTFLGYPLLLWLLSLIRSRSHRREPITPKVSIIIPAHNEGPRLAEKILNTLELDYPQELREIIVVSDGSKDDTAVVARSFSERGIKFVELTERRGKHYAQMIARDASSGEILVFTDASVRLERDTLRRIVTNFADGSVGCVSSEDRVVRAGEKGEGSYVEFEMWLRRLEAKVGSLVSASGSFFGARRELCEVWHPEQSSDFFVPLHVAARKLRTVVDPECRGYYGLTHREQVEFDRKVRTITHGLSVLFTHAGLMSPLRYPMFSWQLISHKLFRWIAPVASLSLFVSNFFLWGAAPFYRLTLLLQVSFCLLGLAGLAVVGLRRFRALELAGFFLLVNAAGVVAWIKFLSGERFVTWQPTQRS